MSLVNPLQKTFPRSYQIDVKRFAEMFNRSHKDIYGEVKTAILKKFWERDFSYVNEKGKVEWLRWLTKIVHDDKTGYIEIKFSEEIQPYLQSLQGNFTKYYIDQISNFKCLYSIRFYEYIIMYLNKHEINKGKFELTIEEIKKWLGLEGKYERFCDFKIRVLERPKKEITKLSDLNFDYRVIKLGRSPYKIEFLVSRKEKLLKIEHQKENHTKISITTLEKAKKIALDAKTGWDLYVIEKQFYEFVNKKGSPNNLDSAFLGFVKKKVSKKH
jgi:plasmid replication initiation protein